MERGNGTLIYGGTFNPVHIGHVRLGIEAFEKLRRKVGRVEFVPNSDPPHKRGGGILPFGFRVSMLEAVLAKYPHMECNPVEGRRPGPSYTYDTLAAWPAPVADRYFLLGSGDFMLLPSWSRGLELLRVCSLVVAPRGEFSVEDFFALGRKMWPDARAAEDGGFPCMIIPAWPEAKIHYLPLPYLEISASRIREMWLLDKNIDLLMPEPAQRLLSENRGAVRTCWLEK